MQDFLKLCGLLAVAFAITIFLVALIVVGTISVLVAPFCAALAIKDLFF